MEEHPPLSGEIERIAGEVYEAAFKVHRNLGPGLLESAYEACLCHELEKAVVAFERQVSLPVEYDGVKIDAGYRIDILVEDKIIVEAKAVEKLLPIHTAQLITYLKLSKKRLGLLINFNVELMKKGIKRIIF